MQDKEKSAKDNEEKWLHLKCEFIQINSLKSSTENRITAKYN